MSNYGEVIQHLRKSHQMTQEQLGRELNVTYQAVSKWENNLSQPDFETIRRICVLFKITLDEFNEQVTGAASLRPQVPASQSCSVCLKEKQPDELFSLDPVVCGECNERMRAEKREIKEFAEHIIDKQEGKKQKKELRGSGRLSGAAIKLIISAAAGIAVFLFSLLSSENGGDYVVSAVLGYWVCSLVFHLSCDSFVRRFMAGSAGHSINMPGIIFSLDFDSILFMLAYKFIIAPLAVILFSIGVFILGCGLGILFSPFCFPFEALYQLFKKR